MKASNPSFPVRSRFGAFLFAQRLRPLLALIAGCVLFSHAATNCPAAESTQPIVFTVRDTQGTEHFAAEKNAKVTVWLFIAHDCPISNSYAPEIARLVADYTPRGVRVNLVYAESDLDPATLQAHASDHGYRTNVFSEKNELLAQACGITITPEVAVIDAQGGLIYRGRIDNRYVGIGRERNVVTVHDLRDALDATLSGRPVATPRTQAIGCAFSVIN
jgi:hypothetical protein